MPVVGDTLTIHGQRQAKTGILEERYHRRERPLGTFTRTLRARLEPCFDDTRHLNAAYVFPLCRNWERRRCALITSETAHQTLITARGIATTRGHE